MVVRPALGPRHPGTPSLAAALRERCGGWRAEPVRDVLAAITDRDTGVFAHYRHRVPAAWGTGRVTVIGDAASRYHTRWLGRISNYLAA